MREAVIGFDTSNYRSSVAVVTLEGEILYQFRELLRVPEGERGLRQSDAVFAHVRNLQAAWEPLRAVLRETRSPAGSGGFLHAGFSCGQNHGGPPGGDPGRAVL